MRTLPEDFLNELDSFLKSENGKTSVVVMPDFFLDRILCLNWNTKTFSEKLENVAQRKGGSIDGLKQAELRGGNAINTASALIELGANVTPIVCTDTVGLQLIRLYLKSGNVDLSHVKTGARITIENEREVSGEPMGDILACTSALHNVRLSGSIIPNIIDEIPILAVAAAVSRGTFEVREARELRNKECDRIAAVANNLLQMGVDVEVYDDGFAFGGVPVLKGAQLDSYADHRIAMAFAIAALVAQGETTIERSHFASISFPTFWEVLETVSR